MPAWFLDSSAFVKRYVREPGTDWIVQIFASDAALIVSRLTWVEAASACVRRARANDINPEDLPSVLVAIEDDFRTRVRVIEPSGPVMTRSVDLVRAYALRASDAIQLASALIARTGGSPADAFALVSSDRELNAAAEREGFRVHDPTVDASAAAPGRV